MCEQTGAYLENVRFDLRLSNRLNFACMLAVCTYVR